MVDLDLILTSETGEPKALVEYKDNLSDAKRSAPTIQALIRLCEAAGIPLRLARYVPQHRLYLTQHLGEGQPRMKARSELGWVKAMYQVIGRSAESTTAGLSTERPSVKDGLPHCVEQERENGRTVVAAVRAERQRAAAANGASMSR